MRYGIDLGGTKIEIAALAADGSLRLRRRVPSPQGDYRATVAALAGLVAEADRETGAKPSVGIGIPGTISPATGLVKNANSVWLIGHPLDRDLADAIGRPVRIANDADCFVLSEASDGAAAGARSVFGVILGTGVGGGLVYEGRPIFGVNSIAGEWGHNPLPAPRILDGVDERPGPQCYCGRQGCIETFLSGPSLARDYNAATGGDKKGEAIVAAAKAGEPAAKAALVRYADRLARALGTVINIFDPEVIVLGGGMSNADFIYETVPPLLTKYLFSDTIATKLVRNMHGDSSGVRGAAWLWPV
ncbi:MAG: ROK family protein [Proteobacteria bacterium]|nr:ROK family protein [Pseudomonadota bacterium]